MIKDSVILQDAINIFGETLIQVISKDLNGDTDIEHIAEEIADVLIMCEQLITMGKSDESE